MALRHHVLPVLACISLVTSTAIAVHIVIGAQKFMQKSRGRSVFMQSARRLAHSKTLCGFQESLCCAQRLGLRRPSAAFPRGISNCANVNWNSYSATASSTPFADVTNSTPPKLPATELDRQLTEMETRMKKLLDNYRLPSEYRKICDEHGQYDRAINFFCDLVAAQPDNWRTHLELSCAYVDKIPTCKGVIAMMNQGALAGKALEQADMVVAANSNQWVSYYARGLNHLNWPRAFRHSEDAIKDLTKCVEIQEQHGGQGGKSYYLKVHVALGDACTKAGKYKEAREAWQRGLKVFPDAKELRARLDTKDDAEQLKYVESQRSLDKPVDTCLSFLDDER